jgi:hypothetical protein
LHFVWIQAHQFYCNQLHHDHGRAKLAIAIDKHANVSFLISDERYCTKTGGDEEYYDAFEAECVRVMGELIAGWRASRRNDEPVGIEDLWAEFTESVRSIASRTIGMKQSGKNKREVMAGLSRAGDQLLKLWLNRRRKILREQRAIGDFDLPRWRALNVEQREIGVHIKHHLRRRLHEHQNRELDKVRALKPKQMREHWRKLKEVGNIKPSVHAVPAIAVDSAGVEHNSATGVRGVWLDTWAKLAQHHLAGSTQSSMPKSRERCAIRNSSSRNSRDRCR